MKLSLRLYLKGLLRIGQPGSRVPDHDYDLNHLTDAVA